jgi:PAS domain S-box-containing protein
MPFGLPGLARGRSEALERIAFEWRQTVDAIDWPILALDPEGRITRLNRSAQRLAGLDFDQLLGRPVGAVGSWQPWREIADMTQVVGETRTSLSRGVSGERGRAWHVSVSFSPAGSTQAGGRIIVVARDVTDVARLERRVQRTETMAAMGTLVSGVAHEVRNPLFAISAAIDALEARFHDQGDLEAFVATLRGEVGRLRHLMQDLLDYGKPSALERVEVDVAEVIASAIRASQALARERGVTLQNDVTPGIRLQLDPGRIAQAVQNLVENAIHHSPPGVAIEVRSAVFSADGRDWLDVSIADGGPGFRPEDLRSIFEPFFTRRRGGTGLGLSIVKRIVEAHGGTVDAANRAEGGAVMTLSLPMSLDQPALTPPPRSRI